MKNRVNNSLFNKQLVNASFVESFRKLDPRVMIKNPIMFTVEVVTFVMLLLIVWIAVTGNTSQGSLGYNIVIFLVLLATVLFANFAEAIAEARGKAQADSLRKTREETPAKRIEKDGQSHIVSSSALRKGDVFECVAGDTIPADGEIIEGLASIDESAITGESAPVIREAGGDKSSVTGGTKVLSDRILVKVTVHTKARRFGSRRCARSTASTSARRSGRWQRESFPPSFSRRKPQAQTSSRVQSVS